MSRMVKRKEQKCEILRHHEPTENHRSQPLTTEFTKHLYENYLPQVPKVPSSKKLDETESKKPKQIPSEEIKLKKLRSEEPSLERRGYYPSSNSMDPEKNVLLSQIAFRFPKGGLQQASPDLPVVSKKVINGSDFMKQIQEGKKPRRPQNLPSLYKALPWTIRDKWAFRTKE